MAFSAIFKLISAGNHLFSAPFSCISASMGAYFSPLTPSTTTSCQGTHPTNSLCTKQFLSRLHSLWLFLSEGAEPLTMAAAWRQASLSPIGCLVSHIWLPAARLPPFLQPFGLELTLKTFEFSEYFLKSTNAIPLFLFGWHISQICAEHFWTH